MKKKLHLLLLALLMPLFMLAENQAYAVLDESTSTLTFYYDDQKAARGGIEINNKYLDKDSSSPYGSATVAVFDASFANYQPVSTANWFSQCSSLTRIDGIENLNTEKVTDIKLPINFRSIESDEDGTTSIKDLTPALSEGEGAWYTLQGQRVAKPGKGLYIRNGKKVIVR